MSRKTSSKEPEVEIEGEPPEVEVQIEGEEAAPEPSPPVKEPEPVKDDVSALREQIANLQSAREISEARAIEAERRAQEQYAQIQASQQSALKSQYDSVLTAIGAAQIEVDAAKRDIQVAGATQDFGGLADAQERLSAATARMVRLQDTKEAYESYQPQQQQAPRKSEIEATMEAIDQNINLTNEEKNWLRAHPDAMADSRKNAKLNVAYFDAMEKGLQRGTRAYFNFIEEQMGYKNPEPRTNQEQEPVVVAAPVSRGTPSGTGTGGVPDGPVRLTKEEAEIARASGITPAEYAREKMRLQELKKQGMYTHQG